MTGDSEPVSRQIIRLFRNLKGRLFSKEFRENRRFTLGKNLQTYLLIAAFLVFPALSHSITYKISERRTPLIAASQQTQKFENLNDKIPKQAFQGLEKKSAGPCKDGYEVKVPDHARARGLQTLCTPGPDAEGGFKYLGDGWNPAPVVGEVPCYTDGTSGKRIQTIYAVPSDRPDRYNDMLPHFRNWAGYVDAKFNESARKTGSELHAKWVTTPDCRLDVGHVIMPPSGDYSLGATIAAVRDAGYADATRKYLIWTDAEVLCGIANMYTDDRHDPLLNLSNNSYVPSYSRIDTPCWGLESSTELHELLHNLGAVQDSAPHATGQGHCTDQYEVMCYPDGGGQMQAVCPLDHEPLVDCKEDDYMHSDPAPGSYLATHWNIFNSGFLYSKESSDKTPPSIPQNFKAFPKGSESRLSWDKATDDISTELTYNVYRRLNVAGAREEKIGSTSATTYTDYYVNPSTEYMYWVAAVDEAGNSSALSKGMVVSIPSANQPTGDRTAPPVPYDLSSTGITTNGFTLNWKLADDKSDLHKLVIEVNGKDYTTLYNLQTSASICCSLAPNTNNSIRIKAYDKALNVSITPILTVKTSDTPTPPPSTVPYDLKHVQTNGSEVTLTATIDKIDSSSGAVSYNLVRMGASSSRSYVFSNTSVSKTYTFIDLRVRPQDVTGYYISVRNQSNQEIGRSNTVSYTYGGAPEANPPPAPTGFVFSSNSVSFNKMVDDSGIVYQYHLDVTGPGYSYSTGVASESQLLFGLTPGTTYTVKAKTEDIWGNLSSEASYTFTTP